ncbi:MAG: hypothetical protein HZB26_03300 [Candidatus Hydrogenedentes bacterium]|nr:hypothetical protein [Candidatus Hydrogenedentota bacterium]
MNQKQVIMLAVLGVALLGAIYWQFFRESPADREYRENMAKSASAPAEAAPAPGASPVAAAAAGPARSRFASDTVNIDELLASVKEVDFDYEKNKPPRDPLAPLIGASTKRTAAIPGAEPGKQEKGPDPVLVQAAKAMKVTGIVFDEKTPVAVVDNTVVGPGYAFPNGVTVDSITRSQVVLKVQNQTFPIELKEQ